MYNTEYRVLNVQETEKMTDTYNIPTSKFTAGIIFTKPYWLGKP